MVRRYAIMDVRDGERGRATTTLLSHADNM